MKKKISGTRRLLHGVVKLIPFQKIGNICDEMVELEMEKVGLKTPIKKVKVPDETPNSSEPLYLQQGQTLMCGLKAEPVTLDHSSSQSVS